MRVGLVRQLDNEIAIMTETGQLMLGSTVGSGSAEFFRAISEG